MKAGHLKGLLISVSVSLSLIVTQVFPNFKKFDSLCRKIKQWDANESWDECVKRKENEGRKKREHIVESRTIHLTEALMGYLVFIRKGLIVFSEKARLPALLKQAIAQGDAKAEATLRERIKSGEGVEIENFREAKEMIELDIHLSNLLEKQPHLEPEKERKLPEEMAERVDRLMEFIREKASESYDKFKIA